MRLDVGCGSSPTGDVNIDIKRMHAHNFVLADAQHLPFKTGIFHHVYSNHVVEHVDDPIAMTKELLRVSKDKVTIKTPHLFCYASRGIPYFSKFTGFTYHFHVWTSFYWRNLLAKFKHVIKIKPNLHTPYWYIPFKSIEIVVEVKK